MKHRKPVRPNKRVLERREQTPVAYVFRMSETEIMDYGGPDNIEFQFTKTGTFYTATESQLPDFKFPHRGDTLAFRLVTRAGSVQLFAFKVKDIVTIMPLPSASDSQGHMKFLLYDFLMTPASDITRLSLREPARVLPFTPTSLASLIPTSRITQDQSLEENVASIGHLE